MTNTTESYDLSTMSNNSHHETIVIILCTLNAPLMLLSILGNALVLAAIFRTPSLRSPSTVFLCSLAVSDLLVGLVVQPVYVADELEQVLVLQLVNLPLTFSQYGVSLCTMAAISVDRLLALRYHMRYPNLMTTKRAAYTIASLWFFNIVLSCLSFWNGYAWLLGTVIGIAACILISTYSYIRIYQIVRQHQLQIHAQKEAVQSLNTENNLSMVRSTKIAINTFIFSIVMIFCYSPVFISGLIDVFSYESWKFSWILENILVFLNSAMNPLLYCWRLRDLRSAVQKMLSKILCRETEEN